MGFLHRNPPHNGEPGFFARRRRPPHTPKDGESYFPDQVAAWVADEIGSSNDPDTVADEIARHHLDEVERAAVTDAVNDRRY
jgi:hypothetical protein